MIEDRGPGKRRIQVQAKDVDSVGGIVDLAEADDPTTYGASLHVWSATDDLCFHLPPTGWKHIGTRFHYSDANRNRAQIKDGELRVRIKGPLVGYTLNEATQGTVSAIFTSGTGQRWCMQWTAPRQDQPDRYVATNATAPASCASLAEPTSCVPSMTLSFTTTPGTSSCAAPPFSGEVDSDTAGTTKIRDLGLACLYFGGGNATLYPPSKIPDGATTMLRLSGTTVSADAGTAETNCSQGAGPGMHCVNDNAMPACADDGGCGAAGSCALDANCYFGPPLPILVPPPFGAITTCVLNVVQTDASGTADASTGASSLSLPLSSRVYITGNTTSPCPKCVGNACTYGKNSGGSCSPTGSLQTSVDCPPSLFAFQAALTLDLTPLTTGTASMADPAGIFCPGQENSGAFGQASARRIAETGTPAGPLTDGFPHPSVLGSVFCIPATGNIAIDSITEVPGPGAVSFNGTWQLW